MPNLAQIKLPSPIRLAISSISAKPALIVIGVLILAPLAANAQGSPFDTGFNAIQGLFTGTIAKVASLVAIVIGGYGFAVREAIAADDNGHQTCNLRDRAGQEGLDRVKAGVEW